MEDIVRGIGVMWANESLRPLLLGAIATAMVIGVLVAALHAWARRRGLDDAIGHRVQPAMRFAVALLFGLGCGAVLARDDVAWPIPVAGIALSVCFMAYFGHRVWRGQPE